MVVSSSVEYSARPTRLRHSCQCCQQIPRVIGYRARTGHLLHSAPSLPPGQHGAVTFALNAAHQTVVRRRVLPPPSAHTPRVRRLTHVFPPYCYLLCRAQANQISALRSSFARFIVRQARYSSHRNQGRPGPQLTSSPGILVAALLQAGSCCGACMGWLRAPTSIVAGPPGHAFATASRSSGACVCTTAPNRCRGSRS